MKVADYLTEYATGLLSSLANAGELRAEYKQLGLVQIRDFLAQEKLLALGEQLYETFQPFAERSEKSARILRSDGKEVLSSSYCFSRVDPGFPQVEESKRRLLMERFVEIGLEQFGSDLGEMATPFIRYLAGDELSYKKVYLFIYEEGDYIGPHNDGHLGDRVNLQFPVALGTATGFRAVHDGRFRLYEDTLGSARILGPEVWHEVLPVMRTRNGVKPRRILISLRFT